MSVGGRWEAVGGKKRKGLDFGFAEVTDFIADAGGFLVAFGGDRLIEARAEFFDALMEDLHGHQSFWDFANVSDAFVHAADHLADFLAEGGITIAATETPHAAEIIECESAAGALATAARRGVARALRGGFRARRDSAQQHICERKSGGICDSAFFGAGIAKTNFFHLPIHQLGQEDARLFFAEVTFHR